jgi:hypothetical protein
MTAFGGKKDFENRFRNKGVMSKFASSIFAFFEISRADKIGIAAQKVK